MENTSIFDTTELTLHLDGEVFDDLQLVGEEPGGGARVESGEYAFILFPDRETAGRAARQRWADMAAHDPEEFACLVGKENLVKWALGQWAGPGSTQVQSLEEWLDLHLDVPEEEFASYDGEEREIDGVSPALVEELGFTPTVAYRC